MEQITLGGKEWASGNCRVHMSGNSCLMLIKKSLVRELRLKDKDDLKVYMKRMIKLDEEGNELTPEEKRMRETPKHAWGKPEEQKPETQEPTQKEETVDINSFSEEEKDFIERYSVTSDDAKSSLVEEIRHKIGSERIDQIVEFVDKSLENK